MVSLWLIESQHLSEVKSHFLLMICASVSGGELFDYLKERDKVDEREAVVILRQILDGLKHLHDQNILHMDLKVRHEV